MAKSIYGLMGDPKCTCMLTHDCIIMLTISISAKDTGTATVGKENQDRRNLNYSLHTLMLNRH